MELYIGIVKKGKFIGQEINSIREMEFSKESDAVGHWPKQPLDLAPYENKIVLINLANNHAASVIDESDNESAIDRLHELSAPQ
ncbi:hypothetical protein [Cohnella boryungensis]|jgi:hypothetical protein|uniref:Uncharacterized protein n=1 Tax=Cohnella boryungensis TaxID=768479 RepID=A0ABV8S9D9_9BACL